MNKHVKIAFSISFVLALSYIAAFYYFDSKNSRILNKPCPKTGDDFILNFMRPKVKKKNFGVLNLRPGQISIKTKPEVNNIELVTSENRVIETEKVKKDLFKKNIRKNLVISSIRLFSKNSSVNSIDVVISRKPFYSIPFIFYQFAFLFIIFCMGSLTIYVLYALIIKRDALQNLPLRMLIALLILLILLILMYFVLNLDEFLPKFDQAHPMKFLGRTVLFNIVLAILLISMFYVFSLKRRGEKLPFYLPAFVGLPILFYQIPFEVRTSADSVLWILNLSLRNPDISFAESLSLMLNKFSFDLINLITRVSAKTTLIYTGKVMGVLFIFSLFSLINSFSAFSYKKKLLYFFLFLTFSFNALLFGFPEFRYYSLPFLMFSFLAAQEYIRSGHSHIKYLILSALWAVIAGLFHGTAYFSFPVILLLPLLKYNENNGIRRRSLFLKQYSAIFLSVVIVFLLFFILIRMFNFNLRFNTAAGGFDGRQFISFLPVNIHFPQAVNFLEVGYFLSRGWIFFITGSFIFLLFLFNWKKRVALTMSDLVLLLFGISQFLIVLFWGFDLGIREFDLYIVPTTFIYLFLLRYLLGMVQSAQSAWKYLAIFSLFSPLYVLITIMI